MKPPTAHKFLNERQSSLNQEFFHPFEKHLKGLCLTLALLVHAGIILFLCLSNDALPENKFKTLAEVNFAHFDPLGGEPGGALTPEPAAPEIAPPPEPEATPEPEEAPKVIESVAEKAIESPPPPPPVKKKKTEKPKPKPKASQAQAATGVTTDKPGGGAGEGQGGIGGGKGQGNPDALKAYMGKVRQKLARHKKYPRAAKSKGIEGVATINFTVNRQGEVINSRLAKSSGHQDLDDEVLALVKRISPLPPIPPEVPQATINLSVPIQFSLR